MTLQPNLSLRRSLATHTPVHHCEKIYSYLEEYTLLYFCLFIYYSPMIHCIKTDHKKIRPSKKVCLAFSGIIKSIFLGWLKQEQVIDVTVDWETMNQ